MSELQGATVQRWDNEGFDHMLRKFKKVVERDGVLSEFKQKQYHFTRSERRRAKSGLARRRLGAD